MMAALGRALRAFGHFWWDFVIGDTPELALATAVIVAVAFLLAGTAIAGAIVLPLLAAVFLLASSLRGRKARPGRLRRRRRRTTPAAPMRPRQAAAQRMAMSRSGNS
ncbi:MAG TPA: hypothetical protein VMF35_02595 [Acidimicrobiales bacterium]|nr:hypothetical protein [Acidimicrobiales bacterium]